jgi:hypothetical protein
LTAIRAYQTQFPPHKHRVFRLVEGMSTFLGTAAGFEAGEAFINPTAFGVRDLVKALVDVD